MSILDHLIKFIAANPRIVEYLFLVLFLLCVFEILVILSFC